jgi:hypothetical protein
MPNAVAVDKREIARLIADGHRSIEPAIGPIFRIVSDDELERDEPVKLLEVNPYTLAAGIVPVVFGALPPDFPYASVVVEVTEGEFEKIREGSLQLPEGWRVDELLSEPAA